MQVSETSCVSPEEGSCTFYQSAWELIWVLATLDEKLYCGGWIPPEQHLCSWISRWTLTSTGENIHHTVQSSSQRTVIKVMIYYRILYIPYWILIQHSAVWVSQETFLKILPFEFPWPWDFPPCTVSTDVGKAKKRATSPLHMGDQPDEEQCESRKSMAASVVSLCRCIH